MSKSPAQLEQEAAQIRERLANDVATLRHRLQPSELASSVQEAAQEKAAPLVNRLSDDARAYGGAASLLAGAVGTYLAAGRGSSSSTSPTYRTTMSTRRTPLMSPGRTALWAGLGMAVGAFFANRAPMSEEERRLFRAVRSDVKRVIANTSQQQYASLVEDRSQGASLLKLAATAFTLLAGKSQTGR